MHADNPASRRRRLRGAQQEEWPTTCHRRSRTPLAAAVGPTKPNGVQLGVGLTCPSPELAQICAHAGFDIVMIDMEHGPISIETAYRMVTAISGAPAEAWIRVAHNDATLIKPALDTGAQEIVVPMVMTAAEAEQAVSASKYPPAIPTPFDLAVNMGFSDGPGHPEVQGPSRRRGRRSRTKVCGSRASL